MNATANLSEQDLLTDLLDQEKSMVKNYAAFITEASCPNLRQVLTTQLGETATQQYQIFDQMRQRGYYETKDAPDADVNKAKQKMSQMKNNL